MTNKNNKEVSPDIIIILIVYGIVLLLLSIAVVSINYNIKDIECFIGSDNSYCSGELVYKDYIGNYIGDSKDLNWECIDSEEVEVYKVIEDEEQLFEICLIGNDSTDYIAFYDYHCLESKLPFIHFYNETICLKEALVR